LAKTFQQKNINNVGNSLGINSTINVSATNNKHLESNLNNDLIKASIPSHSTIKLLDRETFDSFVKTVDPNEVLEDEVNFDFKINKYFYLNFLGFRCSTTCFGRFC